MRFGVCCSLDQVETALKCGADYVEIGASGFGGLEKDWDPAPYWNIPVETTNLFFPPAIKLFGTDKSDKSILSDYISRTVERASGLGVKVMVIGSGAARKAPAPGMPVSEANREFISVVAEIQAAAKHSGIVIAPESLNRTETNVGNDLGWLARECVSAGAGFTADSYHVLYEWDADMREDKPDSKTPTAKYLTAQVPTIPSHVHFGDLLRNSPKANDPMVRAFCARLKELGYKARVSLECQWSDFAKELPLALKEARKLLGKRK